MKNQAEKSQKKRCYISITHFRKLENGTWNTVEEVEVTKNLRKKHKENASVIINVMEQQFEKNRFQAESKLSAAHHMAYLAKYIQQYKDQIQMILAKSS